MLKRLKMALYFPVAGYFGFFAKLRLNRWKPRVVVITGSNGKTTALNMIEARVGSIARYSHHRNSAFGISFDILGLGDAENSRWSWLSLALAAPFAVFKPLPKEKIYVAECDADRPHEADFLSTLLAPEVVVWLNCARTHSMYYQRAAQRDGASVDDEIAYEYGFFLGRANALAIINGDDVRIMEQSKRSSARIAHITEARDLHGYSISGAGTNFDIAGKKYPLPYLLPKDVFRAIAASELVAQDLGISASDLSHFVMPPGRSSLFKGIKDTTIVDSSYNANVGSVSVILEMVRQLPGTKWFVFGDMIEQGVYEKEEHEKAAKLIIESAFAKVVLVGPRTKKYVLPMLQRAAVATETFENPSEALKYIPDALHGGEIVLFKGARFLEGIIEQMLDDKTDAAKLCRREPRWTARRKEWGL